MSDSRPNPYKRSLLRQERSVNTRRAILHAAATVFADQEFDTTTTEDICTAAGVSRSTFYLHFEGKDQLLSALARETARGVAADVEAWADAGAVDEALHIFIDGLVRRMEKVPRPLAALVMRRVSVANVNPRPAPAPLGPVLFEDILEAVVRDGQRRGEVRADVDARLVGEAMAGLTLDALQRWAGGGASQTLRASLEFRLHTFLTGVRRPEAG